jgi:hypothetical protein
MAESKSTCFAFDFKDHSKKSAKFDPFPFNRLGADSECAARRAVRAHSAAGLFQFAQRPATAERPAVLYRYGVGLLGLALGGLRFEKSVDRYDATPAHMLQK